MLTGDYAIEVKKIISLHYKLHSCNTLPADKANRHPQRLRYGTYSVRIVCLARPLFSCLRHSHRFSAPMAPLDSYLRHSPRQAPPPFSSQRRSDLDYDLDLDLPRTISRSR